MYKFIKPVFHENVTYSHCAYLYQDINTQKYYLSDTSPDSENIVDNSNIFMLTNNTPKIFRPKNIKNISKDCEVTPINFMLKKANDYIL